MRAVIYARYSSDKQSDRSIEDQVRLCRERIAADGPTVTDVYSDHAVSGATLLRPGIQAVMQDAARGRFDLVYAEALDRISRDQEDVAGFFKRMRHADVRIVTLGEGEISELHVGLKGTMNALFLADLAHKTRRGLRGRIEAGRSGGGLTYGYEVARNVGADEAGLRTINPQEADVVRRIFRAYAQGEAPRSIAKALNREGVRGPSGGTWGPSAINRNAQRGTGILNNELYVGRLVWNRLRYVKNPTSGKRQSRPNPSQAWVIKDVPELRIVPPELWEAVKGRQQEMARNTRPDRARDEFWKHQRPRYLLSGLVKCGVCGSSYVKWGAHRFACAGARDRATCSNHLSIRGDRLEEAILAGLKTRLMDPALFETFAREFLDEVNRQRMAASAARAGLRAEIDRVSRHINRLVDAILEGADAKPLNSRLKELEAERTRLTAEFEAAPEEKVRLYPNLARIYRERVESLEQALRDPQHGREAFELIRGLIEEIRLLPADGQLGIELKGELAAILALAEGAQTAAAPHEQAALQIKVVAGVGFEPTTFRL